MDAVTDFFQRLIGISPLIIFSRAVVAVTWSLALFQIWRARYAPMANQAFTAALAIILGEFLLIFHEHLPIDILVFFISTAQAIMAISVVKMVKWTSHITAQEQVRIQITAEYHTKKNALRLYTSSLLVIVLTGLLYFIVMGFENRVLH